MKSETPTEQSTRRSPTPTDWHINEYFNPLSIFDSHYELVCELSHVGRGHDENVRLAQFIVLACNSHAALVEALTLATGRLQKAAEWRHGAHTEDGPTDIAKCKHPACADNRDAIAQARAALAAAGVK